MSGVTGKGWSKSKIINKSLDTAKVWLSYDQVDSAHINNDYNVSTVTDDGVGLFTVNFSTALAHADYAVSVNTVEDSAGSHDLTMNRRANPARVATNVSYLKISVINNTAGGARDCTRNSVIIFGV